MHTRRRISLFPPPCLGGGISKDSRDVDRHQHLIGVRNALLFLKSVEVSADEARVYTKEKTQTRMKHAKVSQMNIDADTIVALEINWSTSSFTSILTKQDILTTR